MSSELVDVAWQVTGAASIVAFTGLGLLIRRGLARLDERRDEHRTASR